MRIRSTLFNACAALFLATFGMSVARAATVQGVLTDSSTAQPIANQQVRLLRLLLGVEVIATAVTDAAGNYQLSNIAEGNYYVVTRPTGYVARVYGGSGQGVTCPGDPQYQISCLTASNPLVLSQLSLVNLPISTSPAARLSGRAFGQGFVGLSNAIVIVGEPMGGVSPNVDVTGQFLIDHLIPGTYNVRICASGWICRDPDGVESDAFGADADSIPLTLTAGNTLEIGDVFLRRAARLSGRPVFPAGTRTVGALPEIRVYRAETAVTLQVGYSTEQPFDLTSLRPGSFRVRFATPDDPRWISQWSDGTPCTPARCEPIDAAPIVLLDGQERLNIQVAMQSRQSIAGVVRSAINGQPISGALVSAARWNTLPFFGGLYVQASTVTDAQGRYVLSGLDANGFVLRAERGMAQAPWLTERWPEVRCSGIDINCLPQDQHQFSLSASQLATAVDFTLELGGALSGRVYDPELGINTPLDGALVTLIPMGMPNVSQLTVPYVQGSSVWDSGVLPVGSYLAVASVYAPQLSRRLVQLYDAMDCPGEDISSCNLAAGTIIQTVAGALAPTVDFRFVTSDVLFQSGFE